MRETIHIANRWIEGHCTTNLDGYHTEKWPTLFAGIPQKGDYVRGKSGKVLKVVGITHSVHPSISYPDPYIIVELSK